MSPPIAIETDSDQLMEQMTHTHTHDASRKRKLAEDLTNLDASARNDIALKDGLQRLREQLKDKFHGKNARTPKYVVWNNETASHLAKLRPTTEAQLRAVPGFSNKKVNLYGSDVIEFFSPTVPHSGADAPAAAASDDHMPEPVAAAAESAASSGAGASAAAPHARKPLERRTVAVPSIGSLNELQRRAYDASMEGGSILLTGGAGVGKSFTLEVILDGLRELHGSGNVYVTASTGIAACHVGGTTLHSFAGVGLAKEPAELLVGKMLGWKHVRQRWERCKVLVVDEVSMVDADLFDKLDAVARGIRELSNIASVRRVASRPFGGIQLILCGDFYQLPPIDVDRKGFLFEAKTFEFVVQQVVVLTEVYRQKDNSFVNLLNEMRKGKLSKFHENLLHAVLRRSHEQLVARAISEAAECACRAEVSCARDGDVTHDSVVSLPTEIGGDGGGDGGDGGSDAAQPAATPDATAPSVKDEPGPPAVDDAAQLPDQLDSAVPPVKDEPGPPAVEDAPSLAGQPGATVPSVENEPGPSAADNALEPSSVATKLFSHNEAAERENALRLDELAAPLMTYVALDRGEERHLKTLQTGCIVPTVLNLKKGAQVMLCKNLNIEGKLVNGSRGIVTGYSVSHTVGQGYFNHGSFMDVKQGPICEQPPTFTKGLGYTEHHDNGRILYPVVKFEVAPGVFRTTVVAPNEWVLEQGHETVARRQQVPLKLAWAISIHKSQGMSLENVEVDLGRCFEMGQAYVALSRATTLERVILTSYDPNRVRAHPKVARFYEKLDACAPEQISDGSSVRPQSSSALTEEQRVRMAENRARALARKAQSRS